MSVHPTTIKHLSRGLVVAGTVITGLALPSSASATEWTATKVEGNPNCSSLGAGFQEVKLEPVRQGTTRFAGGSIVVDGRVFDWSTSSGVDAVIVKGGPNANVYRFSAERTSGTDFRAPTNPDNGQPYGLSHITFCFDADGTPTPPASGPAPCEAGGPTSMPNGEPCDTDEPAPCEAGGPTTMPNGEPCDTDDPAPCEAGGPTTMPNGQPCDVDEPAPGPAPCEAGGPTTMPNGQPCEVDEPSGSPTPTPSQNEPAPHNAPAAQPAPLPVTTSLASSSSQRDETQVLGARAVVTRVSAVARMSGPKRCVSRSFRQVISGKGIRRVVVRVNGRVVRTYSEARSRYAFRLRPTAGVLRITARVEFVKSSRKPAKTLRMTVLRCSAGNAPAQARFAG